MNIDQDDTWSLERYYNTPQLVRWGTTTKEQAAEYINTGKELWEKLIIKKYAHTDQFEQKEELLKRIAVCWFLYSKALEQKKPFYNGMFVIKDTHDHALYNFFYQYVEQTIDDKHKDPGYYSTNLFSYARHSTHFKKDKEPNSEYGIEIRYSDKDWAAYDLPSGCSHILMGKLKNTDDYKNRMYLKMEDAGIYYTEIIYHAGGVVWSCARKVLPCLIGSQIASKFITLNDGKFCQKEHLPHTVKNLYYQECKKQNVSPHTVSSISQIWKHIKDSEVNSLPKTKELIEKQYSNFQERFGDEIIIDTGSF